MCIIYLFLVYKRIEDFDKIGIFFVINKKKNASFLNLEKNF